MVSSRFSAFPSPHIFYQTYSNGKSTHHLFIPHSVCSLFLWHPRSRTLRIIGKPKDLVFKGGSKWQEHTEHFRNRDCLWFLGASPEPLRIKESKEKVKLFPSCLLFWFCYNCIKTNQKLLHIIFLSNMYII